MKNKDKKQDLLVQNKDLKNKLFSENEILKNIHITEKSTDLIAKNNQYTFEVFPWATKNSIKKAIQNFYRVNVESIKIIKIPSKKKKIPKMQTKFGWKKGYKKAVIRLKQGEKIEF